MYPRPRGKPDRGDVGLFMFFTWPLLLVIGVISLFFDAVGWLFEQAWFCVLLAIGVIALVVTLCVSSI
jgi:hypothetical protein